MYSLEIMSFAGGFVVTRIMQINPFSVACMV